MSLSGPSRRSRRRHGRGTGKPLGTFGLEQEETKDDWNEEVRKFRERRPKDDKGRSSNFRSRLRARRRKPESGVMGMRFEGFKDFLTSVDGV